MPIKKENKDRYPENWKEIRQKILERADNKCEFCGIPNKSIIVYKDGKVSKFLKPGDFDYEVWGSAGKNFTAADCKGKLHKYKSSLVVLTIAHLDQTPENCEEDNLKALCQKCHNKLDGPYRALHRKIDTLTNEIKMARAMLADKIDEYKKFKAAINNAMFMDAYDERCSVPTKELYELLKKDIKRILKEFDEGETNEKKK